MVKYVLEVQPLYIDTKPYGFYMFSHDYFKAAKAAATVDFGKRINYPAYFLYCRSLELILKSILLATKNYKLENLASRKVLGHDISLGLSLVEKESLQKDLVRVSEQDRNMINNLNKWYKAGEKKFEYYGLLTGMEVFREETVKRGEYPELPPLKDLEKLFEKFLNARILKYINES